MPDWCTDLRLPRYNQCKNESFKEACEATATIYYEAVKAFGKKRAAEILEARMAEERRVMMKE